VPSFVAERRLAAVPVRPPDRALLAAGAGLVTLTCCVVALQVVAVRPAALAPLALLAPAAALIAAYPRWLVPAFLALTWTGMGAGSFGGLPSPISLGSEVLLLVALWRALRAPAIARVPLGVAALLVAPLLASALVAGVTGTDLVNAIKEPGFLLVAALCLRGVDDVRRATIALSAVAIPLGIGAVYSVTTGPTGLFPVIVEAGVTRAEGPFGEPNFFALSLAALTPLALLQLSAGGWRRWLGVLSLAAVVGGVVATNSRGGLIATGVAIVGFALCVGGRQRRLALAVAVLCAAVATPLFVSQLAGSSSTRTVAGRQTENLIAAHMFADHPLVGVGPGQYAVLYRDYSRRYGTDPRSLRAAHSLPLEIAAEQGVGGLLAWLTAAILVGVTVVRRRVLDSVLGRSLLLAVATYLVGSLFLHGSQLRLPFILVGLILALAAALPAAPRSVR
jgi:O-antigen ligase